MIKILIYGSRGWIGSQFCRFLVDKKVIFVEGTVRVDSKNRDQLETEIRKAAPTHVISFIGRTHGCYKEKHFSTIDYLEQPGTLKENIRDNLAGPLMLALICQKRGIHFTYLGTGCIFTYDLTHPCWAENPEKGFTEESDPNFTGSSYSTVKGYTDQLMRFLPVLNLRIRMPITNESHSRNFVTKILGYDNICSIPNSMTVLTDFFPVWLDMMTRQTTGTWNCTNPGVISHNEILELYKELVDPAFTWKNFTKDEQQAILAAERSNNYLDTTKLRIMYPNVPNIKDSIRRVLSTWEGSCAPFNPSG